METPPGSQAAWVAQAGRCCQYFKKWLPQNCFPSAGDKFMLQRCEVHKKKKKKNPTPKSQGLWNPSFYLKQCKEKICFWLRKRTLLLGKKTYIKMQLARNALSHAEQCLISVI